jgi:hypothetical protein
MRDIDILEKENGLIANDRRSILSRILERNKSRDINKFKKEYSRECYDFRPASISSLISLIETVDAEKLKEGILDLLKKEENGEVVFYYTTNNVYKFLENSVSNMIFKKAGC